MTQKDRTAYSGADFSFGLALDGEHDVKAREKIGEEVVFGYADGSEIRSVLIARTVEGDTAFYHVGSARLAAPKPAAREGGEQP